MQRILKIALLGMTLSASCFGAPLGFAQEFGPSFSQSGLTPPLPPTPPVSKNQACTLPPPSPGNPSNTSPLAGLAADTLAETPQSLIKRASIIQAAAAQVGINKLADRDLVNQLFSQGKDEACCADFVSTMLMVTIGSPWGHQAMVQPVYAWGMQNKKLFATPKPGDIAVFSFGGCTPDHVAIVEQVSPDNSQIITIGGNEGPSKGGPGGGGEVLRNQYPSTDPHILGFINPI